MRPVRRQAQSHRDTHFFDNFQVRTARRATSCEASAHERDVHRRDDHHARRRPHPDRHVLNVTDPLGVGRATGADVGGAGTADNDVRGDRCDGPTETGASGVVAACAGMCVW